MVEKMKNTSIFQYRIEVTVFGEKWAYEQRRFAKLVDGNWLHQFTIPVRKVNAQEVYDIIIEREGYADCR